MRVLMIVVMVMVMLVFVWLRHFRLRLRSLIRLSHLSRGQIHAFQISVCVPSRPNDADGCGLRLFTTVRAFARQGQTATEASILLDAL